MARKQIAQKKTGNLDETPAARKGQLTQFKILDAAILCISKYGIDETTFQRIADESGLSQPLVVHYLKKRENIFPEVLEYLVARAQGFQVQAKSSSATVDLEQFVRSAFAVFTHSVVYAKVYLTLSYKSIFDSSIRSQHQKIKNANLARLVDILGHGVSQGEFDSENLSLRARTMNNVLSGAFLDLLTENAMPNEELITIHVQTILSIARGGR